MKKSLPVLWSLEALLRLTRNAEISHALAQLPEDLRNAVNESAKMLDLEEDFDGEGSSAMEESTWHMAVEFFIHQLSQFYLHTEIWLPVPDILYCGDSIDISWQDILRAGYLQSLLMNVKSDNTVSYYGDCKRVDTDIKPDYISQIEDSRNRTDDFSDVWEWLIKPAL